jgi:hypothetical protein
MEHTRDALLPDWLGADQVQLMSRAGAFLAGMGGLPLPNFPEMIEESKNGVIRGTVKVDGQV